MSASSRKGLSSTRKLRKGLAQPNTSLKLLDISPITPAQDEAFDSFENGKHLCLHGYAGTGKTFLALYMALKLYEQGKVRKIVIYRSPLAVRNIGFLPGSEEEKMEVYEDPYRAICSELYGRDDAYSILKSNKIIDFKTTSFIRGVTLDNTAVVLDEFQNGAISEISSVMTRVGLDSRIILAGDYRQSDLRKDDERDGVKEALRRIQKMKMMDTIDFKVVDICRSEFVKEWILTEFD